MDNTTIQNTVVVRKFSFRIYMLLVVGIIYCIQVYFVTYGWDVKETVVWDNTSQHSLKVLVHKDGWKPFEYLPIIGLVTFRLREGYNVYVVTRSVRKKVCVRDTPPDVSFDMFVLEIRNGELFLHDNQASLWNGPISESLNWSEKVPRKLSPPLDAKAFNLIKEHILNHGDRQTYCNMYNNNPHLALRNMDIYLNPDLGEENINRNPKLSGFNTMVIRTHNPMMYYRVGLNLKSTGPDLILWEGTNPEELSKLFIEAITEINEM